MSDIQMSRQGHKDDDYIMLGRRAYTLIDHICSARLWFREEHAEFNWRLTLVALSAFLLSNQVVSAQSVLGVSPFKLWQNQLEESCAMGEVHQTQWVEDLQTGQLLIALYPQRLSVTVLDWVGRGGTLMLAIDEASVDGARPLLKALDLTVNPLQEEQRGLKGAWPFPQSQLGQKQTSSPFIFPWITWSPLTFQEGDSWLKEEIAPIAIDEQGRSLAYRVRYGRGSLTLFGDADALSDRLLIAPENRRFAQSLTWWITKKSRDRGELCILTWVKLRGVIKSRREEQSLSHQMNVFWTKIKRWWRELTQSGDHAYKTLKILNVVLIFLFVTVLNMLTSRRDWKRRFTLRRGSKKTEEEL